MKYTTTISSLFLILFTFSQLVLAGQNHLNSQFSADQIATVSTSTSYHYMTGESQQLNLPPEDLSEAMILGSHQTEYAVSLQMPEIKRRKTKFVEGLLIGTGAGLLIAHLTRPEPCEPSFIAGLCESSRAVHYSGIMLLGGLGGGLIGLTIKNRTTALN